MKLYLDGRVSAICPFIVRSFVSKAHGKLAGSPICTAELPRRWSHMDVANTSTPGTPMGQRQLLLRCANRVTLTPDTSMEVAHLTPRFWNRAPNAKLAPCRT